MHNSVAMRGLRRGGYSLHWQMTKENKKVKAIYSPTLKILCSDSDQSFIQAKAMP